MTGTPYLLFALLFALLLGYLATDLGWIRWSKLAMLSGIIALAAGGPLVTAIVDRSRVAPVFGVHDIILQLEAAMRFLIEGKNPYAMTYFGTHMASFRYDELGKPAVNPALYHFVMPPWYLLFPFLFYPFLWVFGFFDARIPLLFAYAGTLALLAVWIKDQNRKLLALLIVAFHPVMFDYLLEGRSDYFAFFWLLLALFLYDHKHVIGAAIVYALAMLSKQTIWLSLPFVLCWARQKRGAMLLAFAMTATLVLGPFLLWDARSYWQSTVAFLQGMTPVNYPIAGYGLGMVLYQLGIIKDIHAYYPFIYWQLGIGVPVLWFLIRWFQKTRTARRLLIAYSVFLFVFWYVSRYFHNSHIGYVSLVLAVGSLLEDA